MKSILIKIFLKILKPKFVTVGIPVIIQNKNKEILLGKRSKNHPFYPKMWGLPGGMMDYNETLENAAKREALEELDIKIKIIKQSKNIFNVPPTKKCKIHSINIPFYGKIVKGIPKPKDETENVKWFTPSEIRNMNLAYTHKEILKKEGLI